MADLPILPTLNAITAQPVVSTNPTPGGVVTQLPPALAVQPSGTVFNGFVVNRDGNGNPVLRTPQGDFTFASEAFLKIGSEVTLRLAQTAQGTRLTLTSIDGKQPEHYTPATAVEHAPQAQALPPAPRPAGLPGFLSATVLPSLAYNTNPALPQPGTPLLLRLLSAELPALLAQVLEQRLPLPGKTSPSRANAGAPQAQSTLASDAEESLVTAPRPRFAYGAPLSPLPPSRAESANVAPLMAAQPAAEEMMLESLKANSPSDEPEISTTSRTAQAIIPGFATATEFGAEKILQAIIIGFEASGEPVAETAIGLLRLSGAASLPAGSTLRFALEKTDQAGIMPVQEAMPDTLTGLAHQWDSLQQIIGLLSSAGGEVALSAVNSPLLALLGSVAPAPSQASVPLSSAIMFFLTVLNGGNPRDLIGERGVKFLESRGKGNLIKQLQSDFALLREAYQHNEPGHWQAMVIPLLPPGETQPLRFYIKRDRKQAKDGKRATEDTRFIVEVDVSQMGELQLDGFVKRREEGTRFDLFIRTRRPLTEEMQHEIIGIYDSTGQLTGFTGLLQFQTVQHFPVQPLLEIDAKKHGGMVI